MSERLRHKDGIYIQEPYTPPKIPDEHLWSWFRNIITPPYVIENDIKGSQDCRYIQPILYFLARTIHAKTIIEIGVAEGTTTYPLLKAVSEMESGIVYSIDPSPHSSSLAKDMVRRNKMEQWWQFHNTTSDNFFNGPGKNLSIDFAFIDGDHSYEAVYNDAVHVIERLVPGGIVVFHDLQNNIPPNLDLNSLPKDRSPESCPYVVVRVLSELFLQYEIEGFPLIFGQCGLDRTDTWTEGGSYVIRKCFPGELILRTKMEPRVCPS